MERGARGRLAPILLSALATGLALVPVVLGGTGAGYEIEHPLAVVILSGLFTSTLLNLFIMPSLYVKYGRSALTSAKETVWRPKLGVEGGGLSF
jgi:Cu/Ag efflux pump CusA